MANLLTDEQVKILQEVVDWRRRQSEGGPGGLGGPNTNQASDVYVAKVPAAGIPALSRGSTDTPGSAACTIHRINASGDMETLERDRTVYNVSEVRIDPDDSRYVPTVKTKGGAWISWALRERQGFTGTSTSTSTGNCRTTLGGVPLDQIPVADPNDVQYTDYIFAELDGCLVKIPVELC